jgi:hypothetical protein
VKPQPADAAAAGPDCRGLYTMNSRENEISMDAFFQKFRNLVGRMVENALPGNDVITEKNVYQEGNPRNKPIMQQIIRQLMLPGSMIDGFENLADLARHAAAHESCLILMEHYSNFDIPCFFELLEGRGEAGHEVARRIVSVAGTKLNEESRLVRAFTEIFTRIVIVPKRTLQGIKDPHKLKEETERRNRINTAALKKMFWLRRMGRVILVFPTGTRYRPWDPSTGRGLKEIDSYIKSYRRMVLVSINGNTLIPTRESMDADKATQDVMLYSVSPVYDCRAYRAQALSCVPDGIDPKQHVIDRVMEELRRMHQQGAEKHRSLLDKVAKGA